MDTSEPAEAAEDLTGWYSSLSFSSQADVALARDPFEDPTQFTICFWVKSPPEGSVNWADGFYSLMGSRDSDPTQRAPSLWMQRDGGLRYASASDSGVSCDGVIASFVTPGDWQHVAWVKRGTTYAFYRDGKLVTERPAPERIRTAMRGYSVGYVDNYLFGAIIELRIFRTALTEAQIRWHMPDRISGRETGLSLYLPFDDGEGEVAHDKSDRQNHGVVTDTLNECADWYPVKPPLKARQPDDLQNIEGIGPKIGELLQNAGITTYWQLADTTPERLKELLTAAGKRFAIANPDHWPQQARLAAEGRFAELKELQDQLNSGR